MKPLILGTLLGTLVALACNVISWDVLDWRDANLSTFDDDSEVTSVIAKNATHDGIYVLPGGPNSVSDSKVAVDALRKGPVVFAAIQVHGFGSFTKAMIAQAIDLFIAAFLATWLLSQTSGLNYVRRVLFVGVIGLAASVISDLPNWTWWGFPASYTAICLIDTTVTWLLVGLVIARTIQVNARAV